MKTDTLICILFDLLADGRITAREEAEKYDISLRTAFRYMDALTVANVPIYAERGKGGGFGLLIRFFEHIMRVPVFSAESGSGGKRRGLRIYTFAFAVIFGS